MKKLVSTNFTTSLDRVKTVGPRTVRQLCRQGGDNGGLTDQTSPTQPPADHHLNLEAPLLSEVIEAAFARKEGDPEQTIGDLIHRASSRGFGVALFITALPVAAPATPPGVSVPFGILVLLLAFQVLARRESPWLPAWIEKKKIKAAKKPSKFVGFMVGFTRFVERFLAARWTFMLRGGLFFGLVIPVVILSAIVMLVPLPITNSLASLAVVLIGLAMIEDDGWFAVGGVLVGLAIAGLVAAFGVAVAQYGPEGIQMVVDRIKGR